MRARQWGADVPERKALEPLSSAHGHMAIETARVTYAMCTVSSAEQKSRPMGLDLPPRLMLRYLGQREVRSIPPARRLPGTLMPHCARTKPPPVDVSVCQRLKHHIPACVWETYKQRRLPRAPRDRHASARHGGVRKASTIALLRGNAEPPLTCTRYR